MYIFISHSSNDFQVAQKICGLLEDSGIKCFLAPRDIRLGKEYAEEIVEGIDRADAMVLLLSGKSNKSPHVLREIERAVSKNIPIMVCKLEKVELTKSMEYFLSTHQWLNIKPDDNYSEIVECIKDMQQTEKGRPDFKDEQKVPDNQNTLPATNKKKSKVIISVSAIVAVLVLVVAAVFFATGNKENDKKVQGSQTADNNSSEDSKPESTDKGDVTSSDDKKDDGGSDNVSTDESRQEVKPGDTIILGKYNDEAIEWRVIKVSDDGTEAVLIADKILTMKAFDSAASGRYNSDGTKDYWSSDSAANTDMKLQAEVRGNSDWSTSNIRTWLNSAKEIVDYNGHAPVAAAMSEGKNEYNKEAGFLNGFSENELAAIKEVPVKTKGNALIEGGAITTNDKVYLLSKEELEWLKDADVSIMAEPTEAAVSQDKTGWYQGYSLDLGVTNYYWWLREPVEDKACKCYMVGNGYNGNDMLDMTVAVEGFGIRPAITVDLTAACVNAEN